MKHSQLYFIIQVSDLYKKSMFLFIFFCIGQAEELVDTFFEVEVEMEKEVCRDLVCTSPKDEEGLSILSSEVIFNITD